MAGTSLLALLDDIASILDDVAAMSKVAARKTASVLSDDLALNAEQVSGVKADRELPVVWKVAKGSLLNKAILVPLALVISAWLPWAITPLLMVGGAYLSYEGVEKLIENWHHRQAKKQPLPDPRKGVNPSEAGPSKMADEPALAHAPSVSDAAAVDKDAGPNRGREALLALENDKVKGAVRTDFILSAEIIVISLNIVAQAPLLNQIAVMVLIALVMTLGVYGIVAAIVKMDDLGLYMSRLTGQGASRALLRRVGAGIVSAAIDENPVGGGHHCHVFGGRQHPGAWFSLDARSYRQHRRTLSRPNRDAGDKSQRYAVGIDCRYDRCVGCRLDKKMHRSRAAAAGRMTRLPLGMSLTMPGGHHRQAATSAPTPTQVCCKRRIRRPRLPDAGRGFAWFYGRNRLLRGADGLIPLAWNRRHSSSVVPRCLDVTAEGIVWFDRAAAAQISAK